VLSWMLDYVDNADDFSMFIQCDYVDNATVDGLYR